MRAAQLGQRRLLIGLILATLLCACGFLGIKAVEYEQKWKHGLLWGRRFHPVEAAVRGRERASPAGSLPPGNVASAVPATSADPMDVHSTIPLAARGPAGLAPAERGLGAGRAGASGTEGMPGERPRNVQVFFGIYFAMTGLHALHVVAGMTAFVWLLRRALRGEFGAAYFTPVELTALYWHLVDMIWIYLFPLLYLIR